MQSTFPVETTQVANNFASDDLRPEDELFDDLARLAECHHILAEKKRRRINNLVQKKLRWQEVGF